MRYFLGFLMVPLILALTGCASTRMKLVDSGSFQMGAQQIGTQPGETPVHIMFVSAFYMDRFEVTKLLWDEVRNWALTNGYVDLPSCAGGWRGVAGMDAGTSNHPAVADTQLSWFAVTKWCNARSEKEGLMPIYYTSTDRTNVYRTGNLNLSNEWARWDANGYRLPTEAEWEKAARGGLTGQYYPWPSYGGTPADHIDASKANYWIGKNPIGTQRVGSYDGTQTPKGVDMANGYGLYDMAGNVFEWCWDWYDSGYYAVESSDPRGPASGSTRVFRGGSWDHAPELLRCAYRGRNDPQWGCYYIGFRCVRIKTRDNNSFPLRSR